ncbi:hypothetical protein JI747_019570 [Chryseobacterium sp. RG1]|uniref:Uncharacterized protein n=1 Tax=Chryseobacterium tagetis TaxID=2801334 RepID=A0ABS8A6B2_9FLAO|nr:hypothetical protein [Chryseobacterium tagetis]MCA6069372.1 hypothetical protein [Chryseobacterium tagetis]
MKLSFLHILPLGKSVYRVQEVFPASGKSVAGVLHTFPITGKTCSEGDKPSGKGDSR